MLEESPHSKVFISNFVLVMLGVHDLILGVDHIAYCAIKSAFPGLAQHDMYSIALYDCI